MEQTASQIVLPGNDLEPLVDWFVDTAGFRMLLLRPADDPTIAVLEGHGLQIRLDRTAPEANITLRIPVGEEPAEPTLVAPNGTTLEFVLADPPDELPQNVPVFVIDRYAESTSGIGRAGMRYRDLIPDRQGGRFIASHISIPVGGPVPDYVHHHHIRFQMIFCHAGWADLVYEGQGPPFRFEAGDCVLQPPHIRHQVLATSDNFDVVEVSSPAEHDTLRDHHLSLPTASHEPDRRFDGQRFVWHRTADARWTAWRFDGFTSADFAIGPATNGLADVRTVRATPHVSIDDHVADGEFTLWFIRSGSATLIRNGQDEPVGALDSIVLAAGERYSLTDLSDGFEFLEVRVP